VIARRLLPAAVLAALCGCGGAGGPAAGGDAAVADAGGADGVGGDDARGVGDAAADREIPDGGDCAEGAACAVGSATLTLTGSPGTSGDLTVRAFYPATAAAADAPLAAGVFPVVVFGHGYQQSFADYRYVWEGLVPHGYIVALHDRLTSDLTIDIDAYALDLIFIAGRLQGLGADPASPFGGHVAAATAIMGHSTGGGASFNAYDDAATLGLAAPTAIAAFAPLGDLTGSPVYGRSPIDAAAGVAAPVLVLDGAEDCLCPPARHSEPIVAALPATTPALRVTLTRGDHCGFSDAAGPGLAKCELGETYACGLSGQGSTMGSGAQNPLALTVLLPWLDLHLRARPGAAAALDAALASSEVTVAAQP
jgi:hypothetical protein